jgi:hypothetical protein
MHMYCMSNKKKKPYWLFKLIDARKEINYINLSFNMLIK